LKFYGSSYDLIFVTWMSSVPREYDFLALWRTYRFPLTFQHTVSYDERRQRLCCEMRLAITDTLYSL